MEFKTLFLINGDSDLNKKKLSENEFAVFDSKSFPDIIKNKNIYHISEFGPETAEDRIRDKARNYVAELSNKILKTTGKPVFDSLIYKNISAWWFIEISFQEPAYLVLRKKECIERFKRKIFKDIVIENLPLNTSKIRYCQRLVVTKKQKKSLKNEIKTKSRLLARDIFQNIQLFKLNKKKLLSIVEYENLRNHFDFQNENYYTVLPYAEGIMESLSEQMGNEFECFSKTPFDFELSSFNWNFFKHKLPVKSPKPLDNGYIKVLEEIYSLAYDIISDYLSFENLKEIFQHKIAEYDLYLKLLDKIKSEAVFVYNWEGVFRPLVSAARMLNIYIFGMQQALGPYHHGLNRSENGYWTSENKRQNAFCIPDKVFVWSEFHKKNFLSFGYPSDSVEVTGYPRLDRHWKILKTKSEETRKKISEILKLNPDKRYLLFTAQVDVLDTALIIRENYHKTLKILIKLGYKFGFDIIIKPWSSDNMGFLESCAALDTSKIYFAPQDLIVHNADLLSVTDWCVGTFSSIMGEAVLLDNLCFMLNYPETKYYFEIGYVENYRNMTVFNDSPENLEANMIEYLSDEEKQNNFRKFSKTQFYKLFGNSGGNASNNAVNLIIDRIRKK
ncbi:hypothetical protein KA977_06960 [Candidatus Dependentiae bacterium]|nr:hypothetical protein [Candidatus Dependentiae bacterium]